MQLSTLIIISHAQIEFLMNSIYFPFPVNPIYIPLILHIILHVPRSIIPQYPLINANVFNSFVPVPLAFVSLIFHVPFHKTILVILNRPHFLIRLEKSLMNAIVLDLLINPLIIEFSLNNVIHIHLINVILFLLMFLIILKTSI